MKRFFAIPAIALLFLGCTPKPETLSGDLILPATSSSNISGFATREKFGEKCTGFDATGKNELEPIKNGAQIQVKDASGKLVATGTLGEGKMVDLTGLGACQLPFSVANIPASNFYTIEVGSQKGLSYSLQDLKAKNWQIRLSLASEVLADGASLAPATEKDKAARKLSLALQEANAQIEEVKRKADREYNIAMTCHYQWELYSNGGKDDAMSKECRQRFIKEKGKTPESVRKEELEAVYATFGEKPPKQ
jgi:hypothetical protein